MENSVLSWFYFFLFLGEFNQKQPLPSWLLLPLWYWLSPPLPPRLALQFPRTERTWRMPALPLWTVLWQACDVWAVRCSPMPCWVNTPAVLLFLFQIPPLGADYLFCSLVFFYTWRESKQENCFVLLEFVPEKIKQIIKDKECSLR